MASGKYASITTVDLIQQKKLDFQNFYESNLKEVRLKQRERDRRSSLSLAVSATRQAFSRFLLCRSLSYLRQL